MAACSCGCVAVARTDGHSALSLDEAVAEGASKGRVLRYPPLWCTWAVVWPVLVAPLVFREPRARPPDLRQPVASPDLRPPRGLPARSPSALRASLGASARSPARPCRPRGGLQSGEACACEWPTLARPPARLGDLTSFGAAPRIPPVPSGPSDALRTGGARGCARRGCLKPVSPLRASVVGQLKSASPLRVRNGCLWCVFWLQRCHRFQRLLLGGEQR